MARMSLRWVLSFTLVALVAMPGCKGSGSVRKIASLSMQFQEPPDGETEGFIPGKEFKLKNPGLDKISELDVTISNIGGAEMKILNVYLAKGSNKYVQLVWPENDPSGEGQYISNEKVKACSPDRSLVGDGSLLPDPAETIGSGCSFPLTLAALEDGGIADDRTVRLRYEFDSATDEPDTSPVQLVVHVDNPEDTLATQGVVNVTVQVESCGGEVNVSSPGLQFLSASPNKPETQEICINNVGCADLSISNIYLENPSPGDEFTLLDVQEVIGSSLPAVTVDAAATKCFKVRYQPVDSTPDTNRIVIESSDTARPKAYVNLTTGDCPVDFEVQHSDDIDTGLGPLDFSEVGYPDTGKKVISVRNTGGCPITLTEVKILPNTAWISKGGTLCAEIKKQGESMGGVGGCPGVGAPQVVVLGQKEQTFDIEVNYVPLEANAGEGGSVQLIMRSGGGEELTPVTVEVVAGDVKPKLSIGPAQQGGTLGQLDFTADVNELKCQTAAIYNYGYAPLTVTDVTLEKGPGTPVTDYFLQEAAGVIDGTGAFVAQELGAQGLIPVTVCFKPTETSGFNPKAFLKIWTDNPDLPPETPEGSFSLIGHVNVTKALPSVSLGSTEDYEGYAPGDPVAVLATAQDGEYPADPNGYSWWLSGKPAGSAAKLNLTGSSGGQTFVADLPGTYTINATVFAVGTGADQDVLVSDPASVDIVVE